MPPLQGVDISTIRLTFDDHRMSMNDQNMSTVGDYGLEDGDIVEVQINQVGGADVLDIKVKSQARPREEGSFLSAPRPTRLLGPADVCANFSSPRLQEGGEPVTFRVKLTTTVKKILEFWAKKKAMSPNALRLTRDGTRLRSNQARGSRSGCLPPC